MCGRYYRTADKSALQDVFKTVATGAAAGYAPAYNIPPHSIQLIVRQARDRTAREVVPMRLSDRLCAPRFRNTFAI